MLNRKFLTELFLVFLGVFLIYISNLYADYSKDISRNGNDVVITKEGYRNTLTSVDNVPNVFLPYLILEKHTLYFDWALNVVKRFEDEPAPYPYFLLPTDKGLVSVYPLASTIITLPFYILPFALKNPDINYYENVMLLLLISRVVAAAMTAISVTIIYAAVSSISKSKQFNLLLITFLAFDTSLFTITSRGLWMHTASLLLVSISAIPLS